MSKFSRLLMMCLTLGTGAVFANQDCGFVDQFCINDFEVKADFLYFKPTFDDTYFVLDSPASIPTAPSGERKNNDIDFKPGFRVGLAATVCGDKKLEINYSYLRANQHRTVSGSNLWATRGRPDFETLFEDYAGSAESRSRVYYQNVEAYASQRVWSCGGLNVTFLAGSEWAYLHLNENQIYTRATLIGQVEQKSELWGIGPQLGFALDYDLCTSCGVFSLKTSTTAGLLVSQSQARGNNSTTTIGEAPVTTSLLDFHDEDTWRVIPAFHIRSSLNYGMDIGCYRTNFEIGYEYNSYFRGLSRTEFIDDVGDAQSITHYYNYDVQGLFVGATVRF